ncbi:MAG: WHG domain-containing protein [Acidimicrobiia bacterium]
MNAATPSTDTYHHGNLRRALIDEAGHVLESDGAEAITFRGLARSLGVSHAAPGHHFADRNELLAELAADGYRGLADVLEEAMEGQPPATWLQRTGEAYVRFGLTHPERYRMMFGSQLMSGDCPERLDQEGTRAYLLLLKAAYEGEATGDPDAYRIGTAELAAWSIVHGAVMLWLDGQLGVRLTEEEFHGLVKTMLAERLG